MNERGLERVPTGERSDTRLPFPMNERRSGGCYAAVPSTSLADHKSALLFSSQFQKVRGMAHNYCNIA
jgi:hypothetical protein